MDKKAQEWESYWLEYLAGAFLIIAFYLSARGAYVGTTYAVAFLIGAILGRFWYTRLKKHRNTLYITVLTLAVLLGIIIGSIGTDRRVIVILYAIGVLLSYVIHKEKWIKSV
jgi:uncharacterized membrane protein YqgA involved in biofilm formation